MTVYAVTGASGAFGRTAVAQLIAHGVPPGDIVAVVRSPEKVADLAELGVQVRHGDYDRPDTLGGALAGVRRLLLVSASEVGRRAQQHAAVVDAAARAGVERILYTSVLRADTTSLVLAPEHKATEEAIAASGLPRTILRNGWYTENYTSQLDQYLARGAVVGATGGGRIAAATRADLAEAAAVAMLRDEDAVHELAGPAFTLDELAAAISEVSGIEVVHRDLPEEEFVAALAAAGVDEGTAGFLAAVDRSIAAGELDGDPADLERLLGRPATPLIEALRAAQAARRPV